jgi:hypothetical protein
VDTDSGVWAAKELIEFLRPEYEASERIKNDVETRGRNEKLLAALDSLPGKLRFEILKLSQYSRWHLWQHPEQISPELVRALGLEEGTAISYQEYVLESPKAKKQHAA